MLNHLLRPLLPVLLLLQACRERPTADLIIHHAVIYTCDSAFSIQQAMAVKDGRILATGTDAEILGVYNADRLLDADGQYIYPGFIDAHCHFTGYATDLWKCNLVGTASWEEVLKRISEYAAGESAGWIYGRGWDQNDWQEKLFPDKSALDRLFPDRPVFLKRIDGHAAIANQRALNLAGITTATRITGGRVVVKNGQLTGLLLDAAMDAVERFIPPPADEVTRRHLQHAQDSCFRNGITGVHDCGVSEHLLRLVEEEQSAGRLTMKVFALLHDSAQYYERWIRKGPYRKGALHVGGFKVYADGALGSRGACLLKPYSDEPGEQGFMITSPDRLRQLAGQLARSGLQLCTHAIGDSANRVVLKAYAAALGGTNDRRWRIEHAQVVDTSDIPLFGRYSIVPSVQPVHATSDMHWVEKRLGQHRMAGAYAYRSLLDQNGWMPLGTDFPVEDNSPLRTFYAAVMRRDPSGHPEQGFYAREAITRRAALLGITLWAAKAALEENEKGSLEKGKSADWVVMDTDLMKANPNQLLKSRILAVFVDNKSVYQR